jgi:EmrB/QacA subfamily drug resistance transporter
MIGRLDYKWIVGIVFVFGLFMELLDMTIVNVALPVIGRDLDVSRDEATTLQWIVTAYLLSLAVFIPVSGWAGDRFGTKRIFMLALFVFTASSLLCGLAWSVESLIAFRVLQGVGGGILTPVGTAMLFRAFPPEERAKGAALLMIPLVVAPASGPVIGGYLAEYQDWRWIFLINIPVGAFALAFAGLYLREERQESAGRVDVPGFLLAAVGLGALLYALAQAGNNGFDDLRVIGFGLPGLVLLAVFAIVELRTREPMIDVRLFNNRLFTASNMVQLVGQGGFMGALFLLPLLLQEEMGLSPLESGLTTFPQAIGIVCMAQVASRVYGRVGPRRMMMAGMAGGALSSLALMLVDLETSQWWIRLIMLGRGTSFGLGLVALQTATFATISPTDMGRASAVFSSGRQVAGSFGVALVATVLTSRLAAHGAVFGGGDLSAYRETFAAAAVLTAFGAVAAFLVNDEEAAPSMRRAHVMPPADEIAPVAAS